jgi:hypothetical protein
MQTQIGRKILQLQKNTTEVMLNKEGEFFS